MFDDRSYREMEKALEQVISAKGNRLSELRDILLGKKPLRFLDRSALSPEQATRDELWAWHDRYTEGLSPEAVMPQHLFSSSSPIDNSLNESQKEAIQDILAARDIAVVHGPPGTGKTTTMVAAIQMLCARENTVLVTAPSNTAADLLTERLAEKGLLVVRIGNLSRIDEQVVRHTLDAQLANHPESKNLKKVKIQAAEYRRSARQFKRHFGAEERREREHLKRQARELEEWSRTLENRIIDQIISGAQAVVCTLVGAAHPFLQNYRFRTCIIDEAAQALEPAAWIPIIKSSRVILAGDPFQLPPTVKSQEANREGLSHTLIERCLEQFPEQVNLLKVQYRMHQVIMGFSNSWFYQNALEAHPSVKERDLQEIVPGLEDTETPLLFIDTAGCGFDEQQAPSHNASRRASRSNPEEALLIREHLLQLLKKFPDGAYPEVAVLSPYREQVNQLNQLVADDPVLKPLLQATPGEEHAAPRLIVQTIDGFQGQERQVVYISLVRSNNRNEIGFLSDYRRMNVAMTRAQMLLVVVGDSATIGNNKFYQSFLDYVEKHGQYDTAWSYLQ
ncbi:MAG: AAA domain-containing protein [Saprospiraceae bacterium]